MRLTIDESWAVDCDDTCCTPRYRCLCRYPDCPNCTPTRKTKMPNNITLTQDQIDAVKALLDERLGARTDLYWEMTDIYCNLDAMRAPKVDLETKILLALSEKHTGTVAEAKVAIRKILTDLYLV